MKKNLLPILLAAALAVSCQQLFTTSLAASFARDSVKIPSDITAAQATELIDAALQADDPALTDDVLDAVNDLVASGDVKGDALDELIADAGELAVDSSGISGAMAPVLDNVGDLTGDTIPPATQALIYDAIAEVSLTDDAAEALMNMVDLPEGTVEPDQLAFAGMALVLDAADGKDLSELTPAEWLELTASDEYISGIALIDAGVAQADAAGQSSDLMTALKEFMVQGVIP